MATYTVSKGHVGVGPWPLVASQVDTVTFTDNVSTVQVVNTDGAVDVWATNDGSTPAVPSAGTSTASYRVPAGTILDLTLHGATDAVKVISSGTPTISVQAAD